VRATGGLVLDQDRPLSSNQQELERSDQIILRLGTKVDGRQKGVDTRLATDLITFGYTGRMASQ
jgi:hypothetical protein